MDNWNPLTDTVPIHSWIHPWLPLFQSRLEPLYPPIRSKLSHALQRWHPSDASARCILLPWKDVFTPGAWEAFMVKNIIPKLGLFVFLSVTFFSPKEVEQWIFYSLCPLFPLVFLLMCVYVPPRNSQVSVWKNWSSTLTSSRWNHLIG